MAKYDYLTDQKLKGSMELTHGSIYGVARKSQFADLLKWLDLSETSYNYFIMMQFILIASIRRQFIGMPVYI